MARNRHADMQGYESCQQNDMDVDMDGSKEELSFIPSAVSSSAGWFVNPHSCATGNASRKGFKYCDSASVVVEDDGGAAQLQEMQQFEAGRKKGAGDKLEAMEKSQIQDPEANGRLVQVMRGFEQNDVCEKLIGGRGDGTEIGQKLDRGALRGISFSAGKAKVCICQVLWYEERSGREERTPGRSC